MTVLNVYVWAACTIHTGHRAARNIAFPKSDKSALVQPGIGNSNNRCVLLFSLLFLHFS